MTKGAINRPFKYGHNDRREFIVQDSEVAFSAINDVNGNPVFVGRAKVGEPQSEDKWQIKKIAYDTVQGVIRITWPLNTDNLPSSDYEFVWTSVAALSITNITRAVTGVVTVSSLGSLQNGDKIVIQDVGGMTEVNLDGNSMNIYTVANINAGLGTFELQGINTTAYTLYTSGGKVLYGEVTNYTYV
jgi:hypothetical protein